MFRTNVYIEPGFYYQTRIISSNVTMCFMARIKRNFLIIHLSNYVQNRDDFLVRKIEHL